MFGRIIKRVFKLLLIAGVLAVIIPLVLRGFTALRFRGDTYTVDTVPEHQVALIFGARVYPSGRPSAMLADRVATGADLYRAGKVKVLIMSGDNRAPEYNEPAAMKRYALSMGVPEEAIVLDYAGLRTYDSCYRARAIFGVTEAIVVSQNFHLDRALMLCNALGIKSVGVWADYNRPNGYAPRSITYSRLREVPATAQALVDLILRPLPILGEPITLFPEERLEQ
jgi:SanA protein